MGAGKTYLGIMSFLPYLKYPNFRGIITRRTTPQITGPGGVADVAWRLFKKIYPGVKYHKLDKVFTFPNGATIALRHFQYEQDEDNFQGLQANRILVDEGQQYTERQVVYLRGRNRNPSCPEVPCRLAITCNPEKHCYLREWIDWYLDERGFPIPERDGVIRYYIRHNDKMYWADTAEELIAEFSHCMEPCIPTSLTFISANVYDNPVLMKTQPEYVGNLLQMGRVEQDKFLHGCWDAELVAQNMWQREWCPVVPFVPDNIVKRVRAWDISGAVPSEVEQHPDYTVGVLMSRDKNGTTYVEDVIRFRGRHGEVYEKMLQTARLDGEEVLISVPKDPGAAGMQYAATLIRDLAMEGFVAKAKPSSKSKLQRFAPFATASQNGNVRIVSGEWYDDYCHELESFTGERSSRKRKDDQVDATADGFIMLATTSHIPTFSLPNLSGNSRFDFRR